MPKAGYKLTPHPIDQLIGHLVLRRRLVLNLSQPQLARQMRLTQPTLSNYEKGKTRFTIFMVIKFARHLNMPWRALLKNLPDEIPEEWQ